jgi:Protein of unknown function (DUF775)
MNTVRLSNEKPSAIFRLRGTFIPNATTAAHNAFTSSISAPTPTSDATVVLGLSIEPLSQIQPQLLALTPVAPTGRSASDQANDAVVLVEKIAKHLINYVSGFSDQGFTPAAMNIVANWYQLFIGKVKTTGLDFLNKLD